MAGLGCATAQSQSEPWSPLLAAGGSRQLQEGKENWWERKEKRKKNHDPRKGPEWNMFGKLKPYFHISSFFYVFFEIMHLISFFFFFFLLFCKFYFCICNKIVTPSLLPTKFDAQKSNLLILRVSFLRSKPFSCYFNLHIHQWADLPFIKGTFIVGLRKKTLWNKLINDYFQ